MFFWYDEFKEECEDEFEWIWVDLKGEVSGVGDELCRS